MKALRTAVLLYTETPETFVPHDRQWYESYFFDTTSGIAGYWFRQTNWGVLIKGSVFGWSVLPAADQTQRADIATKAMSDAHATLGVDFTDYDSVCVVFVGDQSDAGSATVAFNGRTYGAVVTWGGAPFDFTAHEFGHQIGLQHSYGDPGFQSASWSAPGEYGHPFCIMSAMSFGGTNPTFTPPGLFPHTMEYSRQPPELNGATALFQGWVSAEDYFLSSAASAEFDIINLGSAPDGSARIVQIHAANGDTFAVEFRDTAGRWDRGLPSPLVCVSQALGSTAEHASPGTGSATYRGSVRLPVSIGSASSQYWDTAGFTVQVLELVPGVQVRVRVSPGSRAVRPLTSSVEMQNRAWTHGKDGLYTFKDGERYCIPAKTYPWSLSHQQQSAVCTVKYPDARRFTVTWQVNGQPLDAAFTSIPLPVETHFDTLVPNGRREARNVTVKYEIQPTPDGSRLVLTNDPADGTYGLQVTFSYVSSIGTYNGQMVATFNGDVLEWGGTYNQDLLACLVKGYIDRRRLVHFTAVLPPGLWTPMGPKEQERSEILLDAYAVAQRSQDKQFLLTLLRTLTRRLDIKPIIVPAHPEPLRPPHMKEHDDRVPIYGPKHHGTYNH